MSEVQAWDDFLRPVLGRIAMASFAEGMASEGCASEDEEALSRVALREGHAAILTALAEAEARGRRAALEAAAVLVENTEPLFDDIYQLIETAAAIRALANTTPETRQPETAEGPAE